MKDLLDKISSYNLFNYLLPGVLFAALADTLTAYRFLQPDLLIGVFVYYFLGLVVSRVGSLVVEPALRKVSFVTFAPYPDFIAASETDAKLDLLSEVNNMYRTFCSLFLLLAILRSYELAALRLPLLHSSSPYLLIAALFLLFLFSYRKQSQYLAKRVHSRKR